MKPVKSGARMLAVLTMFLWAVGDLSGAARIKDIAQVGGMREVELIGYGLVTGLDGTGDKTGTSPTTESMVNLLRRMGMSATPSQMGLKNVAAVAVTAKISLLSAKGSTHDAVVSSIGNATSLRGGTLLLTPLQGIDGHTYAVVQGAVRIERQRDADSGEMVETESAQGRIVGGVTLEQEFDAVLLEKDSVLSIALKQPDFVTAERVERAVKEAFSAQVWAQGPNMVKIQVPEEFKNNVIGFIARVESLTVDTDQASRVVLNEKTGTVVSGSEVRLSPVVISHGNLKIKIAGQPAGMLLSSGASVVDLVDMLNQVGASAYDITVIFRMLSTLGALKGELVIL